MEQHVMALRFIDISWPLMAGIKSDPPHMLPQIEYLDHHMTAPAMAEYMGVSVDQLPDGEYAAVERVNISTHNGTHLDAPYHYFSTMNHALKPLEIVVVNTAAGAKYGEDDYVDSGCGIGKAATLWMLERGVRLVGTDGWSWDAPFSHTRRKVAETGDAGLIWEGHRAGREIGYSHLEKLHNLETLPADGFDVVCFPVKVHRASAGWTRAVAILED